MRAIVVKPGMRLLSIVCGTLHVVLVYAILRTVYCAQHTVRVSQSHWAHCTVNVLLVMLFH